MSSADSLSLSFRLQPSLKNTSLVAESDRQKRTASVADRCRVCGKAKTRLLSCVLVVQIGQNRSEIACRRLLAWLYKRPEVVPFQDSGLVLIRTTVPWFKGFEDSLQKPSRIKGRGSMGSGRSTDQRHSRKVQEKTAYTHSQQVSNPEQHCSHSEAPSYVQIEYPAATKAHTV